MAEDWQGDSIVATLPTWLPGRLKPGLQSLNHRRLVDAAAVQLAMAKVLPVRAVRPLVGEGEFYQEISLLRIHQLPLLSSVSAPVQISVEPGAAIQLVAVFVGARVARTAKGVVSGRTGGGLLLPPGASEVSCSDSSAVIILRPEDLAHTAAAISGHPGSLDQGRDGSADLGRFAARELSGVQARQLHALLHHLDSCLGCHPALPAQLGLDDVLLRMVVGWLKPQLLQEQPRDRQRIQERTGRSNFDELLDYVRANLDQPLRLSDLERRSHYSKRALQYAFRKKLDCTPNQWIRQQRLEKAMWQLEQGARGSSIQAIALACGYRHAGHFSSDFKKRFGLTPSAVSWGGGGQQLVQVYGGTGNRGHPSPQSSRTEPMPEHKESRLKLPGPFAGAVAGGSRGAPHPAPRRAPAAAGGRSAGSRPCGRPSADRARPGMAPG
jgi:AraC-like DNA-binding protein